MRRLTAIVLALALQATAVAWAAHIDLPPNGSAPVAEAATGGAVPDTGDSLHLAHHCQHAGAHLSSVPSAPVGVPPGHAGPPPCGGTADPDSQPGSPPRRPPRV